MMKVGNVDDWEKKVCRVGEGSATCSYLMFGAGGFECSKGGVFEATIVLKRAAGTMKAKGDNCTGAPNYEVAKQ